MKIILFCGAFDMVHNAHIAMAKYAIDLIKADKLIFLPSNFKFFKPINKDDNLEYEKTKLTHGHHRLAMLKIATKNLVNTEVSDYELNQVNKSYTINTIDHFKKLYGAEHEYYFIIGSDNLERFKQWKDWERILKEVKIICFKRSGVCLKKTCFQNQCNCENFNFFEHQIILVNDFNYNISSTEIKKQHNLASGIDPAVLDYINEHGLYALWLLEKHLISYDNFNNLEKKIARINHCRRVAQMCVDLMNVYDKKLIDQAYCAGIYHDILKCLDEQESIAYFNEHKSELNIGDDFISWRILHSYLGAHLLQTQYGFKNQLILNAIRRHTRPFDFIKDYSELTTLDKILYCADKLEPNRREEIDQINIDYYRKLVFEDLDKAFIEVYQYQQRQRK
ncbi:nicotinate-nucleotide adenylyltransferase [Ureaplasma urealyticum]|uniref:Probable nicotinate-nucleotide adenylyltransferase n=1 Tax=Ureaplasma urealyticum TaxID=2130 RepID=A0AAX1QXU7_UREUR|nr:nicotinate-nucleotide adenylyltransferase [Ureaplasma urealyticum]MDU3865051.1 nicotinate-nucleotide adenylyltransferase [Ureaplasma urealyticum]RCJ00937.1 nicotinate-nucleotide adenylyltransferase [Ureaplasma urealyticum]